MPLIEEFYRTRFLPVERAEGIADLLEKEDDDGWTFIVKETGDDKAKIEIYDENNEFIGNW